MSKSEPAPLSVALARKGDAVPVMPSLEPEAYPPIVSSSRVKATIAVTLRLDEERYKRLKRYGAEHGLTNQDILVAALDRLFA